MRRLLLALAILTPMAAFAESSLPFMKDMAGDRELPPPWGIGIDFFTMDQDYNIDQLSFDLPGVSLPYPELVTVTNDVQHFDFKGDLWLLPFLNVFALVGHVESDTKVDLSQAGIVGLPIPLGTLDIKTDGTVLGAGFTLAYGGEHWFGAVTTAYTDADLGGDFDSSIETLIIQPRVGYIHNKWVSWLGGMYLDIEESHSGTIVIPGVGQIPFSTVLGAQDDWNTAVGVAHHFSRRNSVSLEIGFGGRTHTLFNWNWRF